MFSIVGANVLQSQVKTTASFHGVECQGGANYLYSVQCKTRIEP